MDHIHISSTESSSVILSQTKKFKSKWCPKMSKQAEAESNGGVNTQNYIFNHFNSDTF